MNSFRYVACFAGVALAIIAIALVATSPAKASDIPGPPDAPCTLGTRMNVHVVDGWLYECACSVLATGFHCEWNLVGQVTTVGARKHHKIRAHRRLIPVLYLPSVTR